MSIDEQGLMIVEVGGLRFNNLRSLFNYLQSASGLWGLTGKAFDLYKKEGGLRPPFGFACSFANRGSSEEEAFV